MKKFYFLTKIYAIFASFFLRLELEVTFFLKNPFLKISTPLLVFLQPTSQTTNTHIPKMALLNVASAIALFLLASTYAFLSMWQQKMMFRRSSLHSWMYRFLRSSVGGEMEMKDLFCLLACTVSPIHPYMNML